MSRYTPEPCGCALTVDGQQWGGGLILDIHELALAYCPLHESAPDLLAALEAGLSCIGLCPDHGVLPGAKADIYDHARAAIAKAKEGAS